MRDISCEVIKDLLPLYADAVCSNESKTIVEEHIANCRSCAEELKTMTDKDAAIKAAPVDSEALKRAGKKFKKTKKKAVIKGVVIGLIAVVLVGLLLVPDMLVKFAKSNCVFASPKITMNIQDQRDGKDQFGTIKLNLPKGYTVEKSESNGIFDYTVTYDESGETDTPKRIFIRFANPVTENLYANTSSDKIVDWFENKGIKELGFNTTDKLEDYVYYLYSTEDAPEYNLFSSVGKKAAAFAYYYGYAIRVPVADGLFGFENEQYKSYGTMLSRMDEDGKATSMYVFNIYAKGITIVFNGPFEKTEVESIMSSIVIE